MSLKDLSNKLPFNLKQLSFEQPNITLPEINLNKQKEIFDNFKINCKNKINDINVITNSIFNKKIIDDVQKTLGSLMNKFMPFAIISSAMDHLISNNMIKTLEEQVMFNDCLTMLKQIEQKLIQMPIAQLTETMNHIQQIIFTIKEFKTLFDIYQVLFNIFNFLGCDTTVLYINAGIDLLTLL